MTREEAFQKFSVWYNDCIENGISPEEVVAQMGGMVLVTDDDLITKLQSEGDIPS